MSGAPTYKSYSNHRIDDPISNSTLYQCYLSYNELSNIYSQIDLIERKLHDIFFERQYLNQDPVNLRESSPRDN